MQSNPYEAPQVIETATLEDAGNATAADLPRIISSQKGLLFCILFQLILMVATFLLPPQLGIFTSLASIIISIIGAVFVFMLAIKIYGQGTGILMGILTLIPIFGLIVLLFVNQKATSILQKNGIKVGLLGAKSN
ncbi:MAG: hypothetical protein SFX18_14580 [Pirellulales bacterium]|nr:hypothetical protein [Pirellulales bacterium]